MDTGGIDGRRLRSIVERIERLNEAIRALNDDKAAIFAAAKGAGFEPKIIKINIKRRRLDQYELNLEDHLVGLYERAIDSASADESETEDHDASRAHAHARETGGRIVRQFGEEQAAT